MKNVQVVDRAENCGFPVYSVDDECFSLIFPAEGQDMEFAEDLEARVGYRRAGELVMRATKNRIEKRDVAGIHGTLLIGYPERREWFPNKRDSDLDRNVASLLRGRKI